jgi:hypothetical protein
LSVDDIVSVKDHDSAGDGSTDDMVATVTALALASTDNLIYFPPGSYLITETIVIPPNARITGQVWSQLVSSGDFFADMTDPKPMIQAGNVGDVGTVEIRDIVLTSIGELSGLILVDWNCNATAELCDIAWAVMKSSLHIRSMNMSPFGIKIPDQTYDHTLTSRSRYALSSGSDGSVPPPPFPSASHPFPERFHPPVHEAVPL